MSASSTPTVAPSDARAQARLAVTVLLPTPPLPEATAITCRTPGRALALSGWCVDESDERRTSTCSTPGNALTAASASSLRRSLTGQAGVVRTRSKSTLVPSMRRLRTNPRVTMSLCRSGSWTALRASRICSWFGITQRYRTLQVLYMEGSGESLPPRGARGRAAPPSPGRCAPSPAHPVSLIYGFPRQLRSQALTALEIGINFFPLVKRRPGGGIGRHASFRY